MLMHWRNVFNAILRTWHNESKRMRFFVTASGTDIGKTYISCAMLRYRRMSGHDVAALKPVQSGWDDADSDSDAARLMRACGDELSRAQLDKVAPWRFKAALAPTLAAALEHKSIDFKHVVAVCRRALSTMSGDVLIEGAGGIMAPLSHDHLNIDLAAELGLPVIIICGTYLGAVSHALSAREVVINRGLSCAALIINESEASTVTAQDTIKLLKPFCGTTHLISCARHIGPDNHDFAELARICDQ
jgi:dethiobiotin synthetase